LGILVTPGRAHAFWNTEGLRGDVPAGTSPLSASENAIESAAAASTGTEMTQPG
jgi:hypothetical protein